MGKIPRLRNAQWKPEGKQNYEAGAVGAKMVTTKGKSGKKTREGHKTLEDPRKGLEDMEKRGLTVYGYTVILLLSDCCYSHY